MGKETNKRSLSDLTSVIGSVADRHKEKLSTSPVPITKTTDAKNERTSEFKVNNIAGYTLESRVRKVAESFKIKPSLKKIVEEIVADSRSKGINTSRGAVYNLLIENALKNFK